MKVVAKAGTENLLHVHLYITLSVLVPGTRSYFSLAVTMDTGDGYSFRLISDLLSLYFMYLL